MSHLRTRLSALSLQSWYTRRTLRTGTKHEKQSLTTAWKQGGEGEYIYIRTRGPGLPVRPIGPEGPRMASWSRGSVLWPMNIQNVNRCTRKAGKMNSIETINMIFQQEKQGYPGLLHDRLHLGLLCRYGRSFLPGLSSRAHSELWSKWHKKSKLF